MQIPVLLEPVANNGYRATTNSPVPLSVEASTREEAMAKLRDQLAGRLKSGAELVAIDAPPENPWLAMAGIFDPDDPLVQDWKRAMEEYRREVENDPDYQ
jgi:hypothetical protein